MPVFWATLFLCCPVFAASLDIAHVAHANTPLSKPVMQPLTEQQPVQKWLNQMVHALQTMNYKGRLVIMSGRQHSAVEIIHGQIEGEAWERVVHLSGKSAEILRHGQHVICLYGDAKQEYQTAALSPLANFKQHNFDMLTHYDVHKSGQGRVAGRVAERVDISPKDKLRYGYRLWLDKNTGLLLKSVTVDKDNRALEVLEFVSLDIMAEVDHQLFNMGSSMAESASVNNNLAIGDVKTGLQWQVNWLPTGFKLAANEMRLIAGSTASTKVYSDGLAAFSIFLEPFEKDAQVDSLRHRGATTVLSRRLAASNKVYLVTVVGEIPAETAMQVVMSLAIK